MRTIPVALALIEQDGRWLVNRRIGAGPLAGLFEFPGGKIHPGETPEQAVRRECLEEVSILVEPFDSLDTVTHVYDDKAVVLHPIRCRLLRGVARPRAAEIGVVRWVHAVELRSLAMPPANRRIIDDLLGKVDRSNNTK